MRWMRRSPGMLTCIEVEPGARTVFCPSPTMVAAFRSTRTPNSGPSLPLEVIMTTLHSGGKFDSKVLQHQRRPARRRRLGGQRALRKLEVEVARGRQLYAMSFSRGAPQGKLRTFGAIRTDVAPQVRFFPAREDFRRGRDLQAASACFAWPARKPICSAASRSAGHARPS